MPSDVVEKVPRPPRMRAFMRQRLTMLGWIFGISWPIYAYVSQVHYVHANEQKIKDFYKTYDAEAVFESMRKAGLFRSC